MKTWIFFTTILVSIANGFVDQWNLIHYSKNEAELINCLENTNLTIILNGNVDDAHLKSYLFKRLSHLFHEVTVPVESIEAVVDKLVYSLGISVITKNDTKTEQVKGAIISALNECSDPEDLTSKIGLDELVPPRFVQEIPELAELLDLILTYPIPIWPYPYESDYLNFLVFSKRSLTLIEAALRRMNNAHELFNELWNMWNRRVRLFYDHRRESVYLLPVYASNRTLVLWPAHDVIRARLSNITVRDPPDSIENYSFEMTRYRALDWNNPINNGIFTVANSVSITESQYYFKRQMHRFFQRLFAYLESVERGLNARSVHDEWKVFHDQLPLYIPFDVNYGAYLETVQRRELSHEFARNSPTFSSLVQSLEPGDQIDEFDLLMMYYHRLRRVDVATTATTMATKNWYKSLKHKLSKVFKAGPSKLKTTTVTTPSTTFTDSSSTLGYDESKRGKGQVTRLPSGKFIPKNQPGSSRNNKNNNSNNNPSTGNERKYTQNSNDMGKNCGKFSVDMDDSEESAIFMTTLDSLMHVQEGLSC